MKTSSGSTNRNALNPGQLTTIAGRLLTACFVLGALLLVAGCQSPASYPYPDPNSLTLQLPNPPAVTPRDLEMRAANYATNTLQEGDVVSINFQYSTNFNALQKITLDGVLNLETVGPVKAAGRTVTELQAELARIYKPQVKDDVVTVKIVSTIDSVYISGAVIRPGKIPMERPMTALEAIMEAGGFVPNRAKLSQVYVLRIEEGKQKTYRLNLGQALYGDGDKDPFYLKPFDIVHVPTKTFNF